MISIFTEHSKLKMQLEMSTMLGSHDAARIAHFTMPVSNKL